jgi:hypothetical protein
MKFADLPRLALGHTIQLAGAIWSGEGKNYLCFLPDEEEALPLEIVTLTQEEWEEFLLQTDLLNVEAQVLDEAGKVVKAIVRKSQRQISQNVSWEVFRRDAYHCRYCGRGDVPLTVDHLVLWEEGGPSVPANLVSSCKKCNKTRGNTPYAEWLNHPYYKRVSQDLSRATIAQNLALVPTLATIPRQPHKPGKRR